MKKYFIAFLLSLGVISGVSAQTLPHNHPNPFSAATILASALAPTSPTEVLFNNGGVIDGQSNFYFVSGTGLLNAPVVSTTTVSSTANMLFSANNFAWSTNGTNKMNITNGGNVSTAARLTAGTTLNATTSLMVGSGTLDPSASIQSNVTGALAGTMVGNCNTSIACGSPQAGKLCYRVSNNTLYQCDGANSWSPVTVGAKVSGTTLN